MSASGDRLCGTERASATALILEEDADLAQGLSLADHAAAVAAFRAEVVAVSGPHWEPSQKESPDDYGLLILDGLLGRRVMVGPGVGTELLGSGDILRPWDDPMIWGMIPPVLDWRVFRPARLAVLDARITALIGRRPELVVNFSSRLLRRTRSMAYLLAISHLPRVEDRLLVTLWHLASNFGRVTPAGVVIPFKLTHEQLGEILGAKRPSVTLAMRGLTDSGQVQRVPGAGYVLLADPADWHRAARRAMMEGVGSPPHGLGEVADHGHGGIGLRPPRDGDDS
jgi:hypothetical protein